MTSMKSQFIVFDSGKVDAALQQKGPEVTLRLYHNVKGRLVVGTELAEAKEIAKLSGQPGIEILGHPITEALAEITASELRANKIEDAEQARLFVRKIKHDEDGKIVLPAKLRKSAAGKIRDDHPAGAKKSESVKIIVEKSKLSATGDLIAFDPDVLRNDDKRNAKSVITIYEIDGQLVLGTHRIAPNQIMDAIDKNFLLFGTARGMSLGTIVPSQQEGGNIRTYEQLLETTYKLLNRPKPKPAAETITRVDPTGEFSEKIEVYPSDKQKPKQTVPNSAPEKSEDYAFDRKIQFLPRGQVNPLKNVILFMPSVLRSKKQDDAEDKKNYLSFYYNEENKIVAGTTLVTPYSAKVLLESSVPCAFRGYLRENDSFVGTLGYNQLQHIPLEDYRAYECQARTVFGISENDSSLPAPVLVKKEPVKIQTKQKQRIAAPKKPDKPVTAQSTNASSPVQLITKVEPGWNRLFTTFFAKDIPLLNEKLPQQSGNVILYNPREAQNRMFKSKNSPRSPVLTVYEDTTGKLVVGTDLQDAETAERMTRTQAMFQQGTSSGILIGHLLGVHLKGCDFFDIENVTERMRQLFSRYGESKTGTTVKKPRQDDAPTKGSAAKLLVLDPERFDVVRRNGNAVTPTLPVYLVEEGKILCGTHLVEHDDPELQKGHLRVRGAVRGPQLMAITHETLLEKNIATGEQADIYAEKEWAFHAQSKTGAKSLSQQAGENLQDIQKGPDENQSAVPPVSRYLPG